MDILTENKLKQLNTERTWASELIAAVGQFLDKAQGAQCPRLKRSCDELITCGLAMISHHTKMIAELRAGEPSLAQARPQAPQAPQGRTYVTKPAGAAKRGGRR